MTLFDLGLLQSRDKPSQLSTLLEMSVPRPYYLWTSLPPLVSSDPAWSRGH